MNRPAEEPPSLAGRTYAPLIGREGHTPGGVGCETLKTDHMLEMNAGPCLICQRWALWRRPYGWICKHCEERKDG